MKKLFISLLLISNIFASEKIDENTSLEESIELLKNVIDKEKVDKLLQVTKDYIENIDSQENRNKANKLLQTSKNKASSLAASALVKIYCTNQDTPEAKEKCLYWSNKAQVNTFNMLTAHQATYRLNIETTDGEKGFGTAVAISNDGKLITAYHNIESVKKIVALDSQGVEHNITIGKISKEHDLAYLHIDAKDTPFIKLSTTPANLSDQIFVLSADNILLKGIVSKIEKDGLIINIEISKGTSGGGIFNSKNELVAIALNKDFLTNTSFGATVNSFTTITEKYTPKQVLQNIGSNNYDYSYCKDEHDLTIWKKHSKSKDLNIQEYHALFLGLCEKVKNRDLTTEEAQLIFEKSRSRLFDLN